MDRLEEKLRILADAAKYDVSCSSSGSTRKKTRAVSVTHLIRVYAIVIQRMDVVYPYSKYY